MYPTLDIWITTISSWYLCFFISLCFCIYFYFHLLKEQDFSHMSQACYLLIILYISSGIGARLCSFFTEQQGSFTNLNELFTLGPFTFYGGVLVAVPIGLIYITYKKLDRLFLSDIICLVTLLGLFWGRIGCFLNGCDYGKIIDNFLFSWMGVRFEGVDDNLRYPTQLFEAISCICAFIILYLNRSRLLSIRGLLTSISMLWYGITRFLIEFIRDDPRAWIIKETLSFSQFISILLVCFALILVTFKVKRKSKV